MFRALMASATGMKAQQMNVDTVAHNLANVNTTGFKKSQAQFQDMLYENIRAPGGTSGTDNTVPAGIQLGLGSRIVSVAKVYTPGKMQLTNRDFDVAIEGNGFFRITLPDGSNAYTRDGSFSKDQQGRLVTSDGYLIDGVQAIPPNATAFTISKNGSVSAQVDGQTQTLGNINLYRFVNPSGLLAMGNNLVQPTAPAATRKKDSRRSMDWARCSRARWKRRTSKSSTKW